MNITFSYSQAIKTGRYSYEKKTQYITEVNKVGIQISPTDISLKKEITHNHQPETTCTGDNNTSSSSASSVCVENNLLEDTNLSPFLIKKTEHTRSDKSRNDQTLDISMNASETDEENYNIIQSLLKSQDMLIEDLDAFLDEIHMKKRQKEFHVCIFYLY
jgi:hypothetical protein